VTRFNVFFDHNCSPSMARMLAGFLSYAKPPPRVHALRDVLPINTPDVDWIAWLRAQGGDWVVVTENYRISTVPAERRAFADARLRMLVAPRSLLSLPHEKRCAVFLWQWPRVVEAMERFDPPVMWQMSPKIGRLYTLQTRC
jgi:hypothetical protein